MKIKAISQDFVTLFNKYCDLVNSGFYGRIDYKTWREIAKYVTEINGFPFEMEIAICEDNNDYNTDKIRLTNQATGYQKYFINIPHDFTKYLIDNIRCFSKTVPLDFKNNNYINMKENTTMNNFKENTTMTNSLTNGINFEFGPARDVAFSPYGMAVRANGKWLTYDPNKKQTIDVTGFNFDFGNLIYKMPIAVKDVRPGHMVLHQGKPIYVTNVSPEGISCIDIVASEAKTVIPLTNMFGFNYLTRIAPLMDFNFADGDPSEDNPFGNFAKMLMMNELFNSSNNSYDSSANSFDFGKLAMISMFSGGKMPFFDMFGASSHEPANN